MSSGIVGLLILLLCIVLFITEWLPSVVTGALGCLLMVLFHVCELSNAFSGFASSIIYLLFGAMIVGNAMFETGAAALIGRQVIRLSRDNERLFLFISGLTAGCLSMFLANSYHCCFSAHCRKCMLQFQQYEAEKSDHEYCHLCHDRWFQHPDRLYSPADRQCTA